MRYIRRKDDPLKIKAYGYVGLGGLGTFDPTTYEEVEGELPEGWSDEKDYKQLRQEEYQKAGLTIDTLLVALWEKVIEGRSDDADALQTKRAAIKAKHPKK